MRVRTKLALGGGALTTATALSIAVGGIISAGTLVVVDPLAPTAKADGLVPFDDCAALREWYVSRAVEEVGPYGWNGTMWGQDLVMYRSAMPMGNGLASMPLAADAGAELPRVNSATGTNTQEADVDEPDVAKTDGARVVRMVGGNRLVVADVTGAEPRVVGRLELPGKDLTGAELLLVGDHALVLVGDYDQVAYPVEAIPDFISARPAYWQVPTGTKLFDVDLGDPTAPRLAHVDRYTGSLVSARQYGSTIRLVTTDGRPELPFVTPGKGISERQALRRNRALVRATTVEDWMPAVTTNGRRSTLVECRDVLHPKNWSGQATLAVTTFDASDVEDRTSVAITAEGHVVYSSTDRLYVAANRMEEPVALREDVVPSPRIAPLRVTTDLHSFALDGPTTTYVASGEVAGTLRDRWSLDERDGILRVAWTRENRRGGTRNGITTLAERGGDLVRVGEIGDLGIDENIQSVRWLGTIAIVVTFRQLDPLYTIDLTDPARPRELGALKIPGYSGYLHPLGGDRLLGLGVHATNDGSPLGAQAATFDIGDLTAPRRLDTVGFGQDTELVAVNEPRTFTWLAGRKTGLTVVSDWMTGRSRLVALRVTPDGTLTERTALPRVDGWETRVLPLDDGRAVVVDRTLRIVDLDA